MFTDTSRSRRSERFFEAKRSTRFDYTRIPSPVSCLLLIHLAAVYRTDLKMAAKTKASDSAGDDFARHAEEDTALASPNELVEETSPLGLTTPGKLFIFIVFPLTIGVLGLYMAYLETRRNPDKKLSFDQDFMVPFLLALAMAIVIGFQTGGFTSSKVKPLVSWPKVRRVKKIIRKKKGQSSDDGDDSDKKNN